MPANAKELKVNFEEVAQAVEIISQLEPKPGRSFDSLETPLCQSRYLCL